MKSLRVRSLKSLFSLFMLVSVMGSMFSCNKRIDAGHEGILVNQYGTDKGVQNANLVTGRVWYNPMTQDVFEFPVFVQTVDYDPFTVNAKDGSVFTVDPTISFFVQPGHTPHIFTKYRKELSEIASTTLYNYVKDAFRMQMNNYTTEELISNRARFENHVQATLDSTLVREGFKLDQLTSGLKYPETIVQAINLKNQAVQKTMQAENELKTATFHAEKKIIEAKAEAEANRLRQATLTPLLVQQQFIEKWDGHAPLYGQAPTLFRNVN